VILPGVSSRAISWDTGGELFGSWRMTGWASVGVAAEIEAEDVVLVVAVDGVRPVHRV
jgi:aspartokinase-like uncharacterized kinase